MTILTEPVFPYLAESSEVIEFGFADQRGRAIGIIITRREVEYVAAPAGRTWGYQRAPGRYFYADAHVTRNDKRFGAMQADHYFDSEAEREAWITKRVASCRKANAKKFAAQS